MKSSHVKRVRWAAFASLAVIGVAVSQGGLAFGSKKSAPAPGGAPSSANSSSSEEPSVWVKRPDGGKQCAPDSAQDLDLGSKELAKLGIPVLESSKKNDGKMRIQVCGQPTGSENSYRIPRSSLSKASALGFKELQ